MMLDSWACSLRSASYVVDPEEPTAQSAALYEANEQYYMQKLEISYVSNEIRFYTGSRKMDRETKEFVGEYIWEHVEHAYIKQYFGQQMVALLKDMLFGKDLLNYLSAEGEKANDQEWSEYLPLDHSQAYRFCVFSGLFKIAKMKYDAREKKFLGLYFQALPNGKQKQQIDTLDQCWIDEQEIPDWFLTQLKKSTTEKFTNVPVGKSSDTLTLTKDYIQKMKDESGIELPKIQYQQYEDPKCVTCSLASLLHHIGYADEAKHVKNMPSKLKSGKLYNTDPCILWNKLQTASSFKKFRSEFDLRKLLTRSCILELMQNKGKNSPECYWVVLKTSAGDVDHCIGVGRGFIFNSNYKHVLPFSKDALDICCYPSEYDHIHSGFLITPKLLNIESKHVTSKKNLQNVKTDELSTLTKKRKKDVKNGMNNECVVAAKDCAGVTHVNASVRTERKGKKQKPDQNPQFPETKYPFVHVGTETALRSLASALFSLEKADMAERMMEHIVDTPGENFPTSQAWNCLLRDKRMKQFRQQFTPIKLTKGTIISECISQPPTDSNTIYWLTLKSKIKTHCITITNDYVFDPHRKWAIPWSRKALKSFKPLEFHSGYKIITNQS